MANYAELNQDNQVIRVIVIPDDVEPTEQEGIAWCENLLGGRWIKTSYNNNIRKNFAGVGFIYDTRRDAFIPPRPYPSWRLNEDDCRWYAPISAPTEGGPYVWDDYILDWVSQPIL
jgi:hypothetical protein